MKRTYFYLAEQDRKAAERMAKDKDCPFSVFIRQAVLEKLDRELVVGQAQQMRNELAGLVDEFRTEIARTRRDLMDDQQRGVELVRADIGKSMRKNEEATKSFVLALSQAIGGASPVPNQEQPKGSVWDEDPPAPVRPARPSMPSTPRRTQR